MAKRVHREMNTIARISVGREHQQRIRPALDHGKGAGRLVSPDLQDWDGHTIPAQSFRAAQELF